MELDVHLSREGEEPWGFELIGGANSGMPLTIDKVYPSSPAHAAGLQSGDIVARIGDRLATKLSQDAAAAIVAEAIGSLSFGICRGLYDPVLDDYEPIYEPIEQADSDLRSEPTEVPFHLQQFIENNELSLDDPRILDPHITDPNLFDSGYYGSRPVTETRSLNASPFVPNTKTYRPFSTEPLEVPTLDDPLILNPNYKDDFAKAFKEDGVTKVETIFKLPVSEKYDPNYEKKVAVLLEECIEQERRGITLTGKTKTSIIDVKTVDSTKVDVEVRKETEEMVKEVKVSKSLQMNNGIENLQQMSNHYTELTTEMKKEIDMNKIEQTAFDVVEESIERAVSVTEEIHKEVEEELRSSMSRELQKSAEARAEIKTQIENTDRIVEESFSRNELDISQKEINNATVSLEEVNNRIVNQQSFKEKSLSMKDREEIIEAADVRQKSSTVLNDEQLSSTKISIEKERTDFRNAKSFSEKTTSDDYNAKTFESEGRQKSYMIGLQTIPHIKGFVQSSYHFDLLLRTFFVHLTDVMVALSRFILTQPASKIESQAENVAKKSEYYETKDECNRKVLEVSKHKDLQKKEIRQDKNIDDMSTKQEVITQAKIAITEEDQSRYIISTEELDRTKKSGSEMAQRTQRKSKDLTQKMDAVINEFQTKTDHLEIEENTMERCRSRSRSRIEEEVMSESDPLEWLDKVDSRRASQERTVVSTNKSSSAYSESKQNKSVETKSEFKTVRSKTKSNKPTYVAIVESHVYTNKDAILEDLVEELSETASVQSAEEVNSALESMETVSMEKVALNNSVKEEKRQAVEVIGKVLDDVAIQENHQILEAVSDLKASKIFAESKTITHQDSSHVKNSHVVVDTEDTSRTAAAEFEEISLDVIKEMNIISKASEKEASATQELLSTVAAETIETVADDSFVKTFKSQELKSKTALVTSEENYKSTAIKTSEMLLEATKEEKSETKVSEKQASAKIESLSIAVAESTDVVKDDSKLEEFAADALGTKIAKTASEETYKKAAVESTEVTLESVEEEHLELNKSTGHVTIREETQGLSVAGIIETKTELCKEVKKPEDEYACLKIVKEQQIDADESESIEILESEVNISKVESSFTAQSNQSSYQSITSINRFESNESKLHIQTNLPNNCDENNNTPSPTTVPPTPLTDEYVFKLEIPLPKNITPVPKEDSPIDEDPHIVKKKLIPHIEICVEDQIIYDPPLPTPTEEKPQSPVYTKPGLRGGGEPLFRKEYIREIERKSSLLASAIDQTIRSIEEYKEEVGIESNTEVNIQLKKNANKITTSTEENTNYKAEFELTNGYTNGFKETTHNNDVEVKLETQANESEDTKNETRETTNKVDVASSESMTAASDLKGNLTERCRIVETPLADAQEKAENDVEELPGFKPVVFNPEAYKARLFEEVIRGTNDNDNKEAKKYVNEAGQPLGTVHGIIDGLEEATVDEEVAKELGKPGLTEDKIAVLISGESEMLREAHVMGLSRVLSTHMHRPDDSSVDFQKIKPLVESLKDSEVIKALNEEILKRKEEEKKKEKKWTTFLQKPKRPVPRAKFGYPGYVEEEDKIEEPYKVKIVKQPKPKVAPDYKPENFDTGPLPWEERALNEPSPPPVDPEEPILVPEGIPEFLEAVDPLPESEVPDLEDTGIPLPPPCLEQEDQTPQEELPAEPVDQLVDQPEDQPIEQNKVEEPEAMHDTDQNKMAEQLVNSVRNMIDPNASLDQQLAQMRAQLAALAQLPCVIQQSLEMLTRQLSTLSQQESHTTSYQSQMQMQCQQEMKVSETMETIQEYQESDQSCPESNQEESGNCVTIEEIQSPVEAQSAMTREEYDSMKRQEAAILEEQMKREKQQKEQLERARIEQESRQIKQRSAPRVGRPQPKFGPLNPQERPLVLPGGRRWRGPKDAYNDQMIAETLQAQAELIHGKTLGVNFMKYEKPPVSLDHLQNSAVYKLVHNMDQEPVKRVDMLTPVISEADYRERCRSATPGMIRNEKHLNTLP